MDPTQATQAIEKLMQSIKGDANLAYATRYLTLIGLFLVVYDHVITFPAEWHYIWPAPPSFHKYAFLVNRYSVPLCLLLGFIPLSGFIGLTFSDLACRVVLPTTAMLMVLSLGLGNAVIAIHVTALWNFEKSKLVLMLATYVLTYAVCIATYLVDVLKGYHYVVWSPVLNMCVLTRSSAYLTVSWATPLAFELLVLAMTCWNAVDRPRQADLPLRRVLQKDGINFFLIMTLLRAVNLCVVATEQPGLVLLGAFFTWSLATITLHRSLLTFRRAELVPTQAAEPLEAATRASSCFTSTPRPLSHAATIGARRKGSESSAGCSSRTGGESWGTVAGWDVAEGAVEIGTVESESTRR